MTEVIDHKNTIEQITKGHCQLDLQPFDPK
jgi:hypothetical protein